MKDLKKSFDYLCENFGLSATAAFNIFMKTVVRERKIPFEIKASSGELIRDRSLKAFNTLRQIASGLPEMSLDEINEEIKAARDERKQ